MDDKLRNSIKSLTRAFYDYQKERQSLDNRMGMTKDGKKKKKAPERDIELLIILKERRDAVFAMELEIGKELAKLINQHPLWQSFLSQVKGVGETMAAVIISEFDIHKAPTASSMWAFAGLAPGKDRKIKGQKCPFNQFLRSKLCGVLGPSFLKCNSPYSEVYYNYKNRLENSDKEIIERCGNGKVRTVAWRDASRQHRHFASIRKMIKHLLQDVYVAWRTLEGLPMRAPYSEEYLGKKHNDVA